MLIYESNSMVLCSRRSSSLGWNRKHDFMASDSSRRSIKNTSPCCVRLSSRIKVIINFTSRDIFIQSCARSSFKDFLAATANKNPFVTFNWIRSGSLTFSLQAAADGSSTTKSTMNNCVDGEEEENEAGKFHHIHRLIYSRPRLSSSHCCVGHN